MSPLRPPVGVDAGGDPSGGVVGGEGGQPEGILDGDAAAGVVVGEPGDGRGTAAGCGLGEGGELSQGVVGVGGGASQGVGLAGEPADVVVGVGLRGDDGGSQSNVLCPPVYLFVQHLSA
jgi:hypothetical protein